MSSFRLIISLVRPVPVMMVLGSSSSSAPQNAIDYARAAQYFKEAQTASELDHGALWKATLCGPILFVDPETRTVVANQPDREDKLQAKQAVFVGKLPPEATPANTATRWAGVEWTMVMWPPGDYHQDRVRLLMHECFHRLEPAIGLTLPDLPNSHLDTLDGRIWLMMEWRALEHALWSQGGERVKAIEDALYFRNFRRSLFPGAVAAENALELNEGLAEYTGVRLSTSSPAEFAMLADAALREAPVSRPNFVRSFAYASGPAYGLLLDEAGVDWRPSLTPKSDLGQLLARAYQIELPVAGRPEALRRAEAYHGNEVIARETSRERNRQEQISAARQRFIESPVLILPVGPEFRYGFNPNAVLALDDTSTVYNGDVQITDVWGILHTSDGALLVRQGDHVVRAQVPGPSDSNSRPIKGDHWTLELKAGWTVVPASRHGDLTLQKATP